MKNKLLVCFRPPVDVVESESEAVEVSVNTTTTIHRSSLRKSKSLMIKSNTKLEAENETKNIKHRKKTNRSISGSFEGAVVGHSLKRSSSLMSKSKENKKLLMGGGAESRSGSRWMVYLILVISFVTTVLYGRVYSVLVTCSCLILCFPRLKTSSLSTRSGRFQDQGIGIDKKGILS
ncbi:uncharacterized protein LOC124932849 [Impatiens glandulifera]|uniref:uncharacterized protein LOC124932849 n=1 Tax=Impatiens glandulifera TaxID=253017 RepID=UPI001FB0C378|nr:uncharacterized protein LOC124932849 [Impatiens glandulifera]